MSMKENIESYICYIRDVRRYSPRTQQIYSDVLTSFNDYCGEEITPTSVRNYIVYLMDERKESPRTVNLHISVLSGFCKYLIKKGIMDHNPVRMVQRPKVEKRLPTVYKEDSMKEYFTQTEHSASEDELEILRSAVGTPLATEMYERRLRRLLVTFLFSTGLRRAELISLNRGDMDFSRQVLSVTGKGNKMREVPVVGSLCNEVKLYLQAVEAMGLEPQSSTTGSPLLVTVKGSRLYPVYVDRAIKKELGDVPGITTRKSPHVLRHTIATELLNEGTDINSIKELLGHASLAATQVYTHNSVEKLKRVYAQAHPRASKDPGSSSDSD